MNWVHLKSNNWDSFPFWVNGEDILFPRIPVPPTSDLMAWVLPWPVGCSNTNESLPSSVSDPDPTNTLASSSLPASSNPNLYYNACACCVRRAPEVLFNCWLWYVTLSSLNTLYVYAATQGRSQIFKLWVSNVNESISNFHATNGINFILPIVFYYKLYRNKA